MTITEYVLFLKYKLNKYKETRVRQENRKPEYLEIVRYYVAHGECVSLPYFIVNKTKKLYF